MNVPPYIPENLKADFPEFKQASDILAKAFINKVHEEIGNQPGMLSVIQMVFEVGFMTGVSFIKDNPDL